jgi:hypothetical protein
MKHQKLFVLSVWSSLLSTIVCPVEASPIKQVLAQTPFGHFNRVAVLSNPNWQDVINTEVGQHPAETLMDLNGIVRDEDAVTFDVMGYRGTYYRMVGHCQTRQVAVIRRGLSQSIQQFSYEEVQPNPAESLDWHRQLLAFACQNSDDCPEKIAEQKKLQEQLNLLEQTEEKYAYLAGMLQSKTYDFSRILGGWEDTLVDLERLSTELTSLETQLHEKMPNNQYQEWLKEYQSANSNLKCNRF